MPEKRLSDFEIGKSKYHFCLDFPKARFSEYSKLIIGENCQINRAMFILKDEPNCLIKIGDNYHYIDFLLFNYKFNCFVVVELKVTEFKAEYIGQITKYINYVDKNIKELFNDKTVGVVICKKENKYVLEYCTDDRIFTTTYKMK